MKPNAGIGARCLTYCTEKRSLDATHESTKSRTDEE